MPNLTFTRSTDIASTVEALREWHFRPGTFKRLTPPWEHARVMESPYPLQDGARAVIEIALGPLRRNWIAEHDLLPDGFRDRQIEGPFAFWEHTHRFESTGPASSRLTDSIRYRLPLGLLGKTFGKRFTERKLARMFRYRQDITATDLARAATHPAPAPLRILVSGATGMIGTPLCAYLSTLGHEVVRLTRSPRRANDLFWDPVRGQIDIPPSQTFDAVIHLAGESVASGRWTPDRKRRLLESRRDGTRLLAETVSGLPSPPKVFVSASGSGYYPTDGAIHDETSGPGNHFLARVCREWEEATAPVEEAGIRTVHARIGVVLDSRGGALQRLLPVFRAGMGGRLGSGAQRMSWIALDDVLDILQRALFEGTWKGALNLTAPDPITNADFSETLAAVLRRPAWLPIPATALNLVFGEMARETLLADIAVVPLKLISLGYRFRHPHLESALRHLLGRQRLNDPASS